MAEETGYSYAQIYGIVHRGRPVGKRLVKIVVKLTAKPKKRNSAKTDKATYSDN